jgi:pyruvate formate lyase activating enzyme
MNKKAMFFEKSAGFLICTLCPKACVFKKEDSVGDCGCYIRKGNELYSVNYGKVCSIALDPIEKKPLARFYGGTNILSVGTFGCNMHCPFCQNYSISQFKADSIEMTAEDILKKAKQTEIYGNIGVAFTYNEPFVWYEFVYDCALLLKENGMKVVLVSNGQVNSEPLKKILPYIDAVNIDLKSIKEDFYTDYCKGNINTVRNTIKKCFESGVHVELTNLVIPGRNDTIEEFEELTDFIKDLSCEIPLHISRYFPRFKEKNDYTPLDTILNFKKIAEKKLKFVYTGNI